MRGREKKEKKNKVVDLNPTILIITLSVTVLNTAIER